MSSTEFYGQGCSSLEKNAALLEAASRAIKVPEVQGSRDPHRCALIPFNLCMAGLFEYLTSEAFRTTWHTPAPADLAIVHPKPDFTIRYNEITGKKKQRVKAGQDEQKDEKPVPLLEDHSLQSQISSSSIGSEGSSVHDPPIAASEVAALVPTSPQAHSPIC